jgi:hypothetical protein
MSNVFQNNRIRSNLNQNPRIQVKTVSLGSKISLSQIEGIDMTNATDGAVLLYDGGVSKFKATTTMDNQNTNIFGGIF